MGRRGHAECGSRCGGVTEGTCLTCGETQSRGPAVTTLSTLHPSPSASLSLLFNTLPSASPPSPQSPSVLPFSFRLSAVISSSRCLAVRTRPRGRLIDPRDPCPGNPADHIRGSPAAPRSCVHLMARIPARAAARSAFRGGDSQDSIATLLNRVMRLSPFLPPGILLSTSCRISRILPSPFLLLTPSFIFSARLRSSCSHGCPLLHLRSRPSYSGYHPVTIKLPWEAMDLFDTVTPRIPGERENESRLVYSQDVC